VQTFIVACLAILVIAIGSAVVLDRYQQDSEVAYTSPLRVRI